MKRVAKYFLIMAVIITTFCFISINYNKIVYKRYTDDISHKIIRFHVIANSDNADDQILKLKVRDAVLHYISPELQKCKNIDESRKVIKDKDNEIKKVALNVIKKNKYNYNVTTCLSKENFPVKSYGNIILPEGKYEAYRIIIENGKGQNWWCVMFPPLCFVDVTVSEENIKKADEEIKKVLNEDEYKMITQNDDNITMRFKTVEIVKKIAAKISSIKE